MSTRLVILLCLKNWRIAFIAHSFKKIFCNVIIQVLTLRAKVDLWVMAMKTYTILSRSPEQEPHHQTQFRVISKIFPFLRVLPLCNRYIQRIPSSRILRVGVLRRLAVTWSSENAPNSTGLKTQDEEAIKNVVKIALHNQRNIQIKKITEE